MIAGLTGGIIGALSALRHHGVVVALMVPATFAMNPTSGLIALGAIYAGAIYMARTRPFSSGHAGHAFRGDHTSDGAGRCARRGGRIRAV